MTDQQQRSASPAGPSAGGIQRRPLPADLVPRIAPPLSPASPKPTGVLPHREAPARPGLSSPNAAPVLVKATPPLSIRVSQLLWILSFVAGGFALVYFVAIREDLLPLIAERAAASVDGRSEETYTAAANIVFWWVFTFLVSTMLLQITFLVSFMGRRRGIRWWQFATLLVLGAILLMSPEWIALGETGEPLQLLLAAQSGLVLLALLVSILPGALAWSAREHDIRRGPIGPGNTDL